MIDILRGASPWKATTSGERLLFMLLGHHQEFHVLKDVLDAAAIRMARRFEGLADFFLGASVFHLQQRLIKLAQDAREGSPFDRQVQIKTLRAAVCDVLQLTPIEYAGDFGELVEEVLLSAEQGPREARSSLKARVFREGPKHCYSCGRLFGLIYDDAPGPWGLTPTADHVWPRALGGDTTEDNLLPACASCNEKKDYIATWQMAWIQPVVFAEISAVHAVKVMQREVKLALHTRAAMTYAQMNGATLRDAFIAIGPREPPQRIDASQGYDFFNLRVHDEKRTNVYWDPA